MDRKCSLCGRLGHNSRTCANRKGIRLFGVWLDISSSAIDIKKSFIVDSMNSSPSPSSSSLSSPRVSFDENSLAVSFRCPSDSLAHGALQESTKGRQWTGEEHMAFLKGVEKLGKGDWRGISRSFVKTRTSTQVASHAQKYFLRKKRRTSSLDLVEWNNKVVHPKREELDATVPPLLISRLPGSRQNFSSAGKTSSPDYGPDLELSLNTNHRTLGYDHCHSI